MQPKDCCYTLEGNMTTLKTKRKPATPGEILVEEFMRAPGW